MAVTDNLRYTKLPLNHGSGAIPALGFGTLIPDPVVTKQATKKSANRIQGNFDISTIPEEAMAEINKISTRIRFNTVVNTGVPGFIARVQ